MEIPLTSVCLSHPHSTAISHKHTHTHTRTHAILLGVGSAARKSGGTNYSSLLFLSLPRQPHKTALQPLQSSQVQVGMPTDPLGCEGVYNCWFIGYPGLDHCISEKGLFSESALSGDKSRRVILRLVVR